MDDRSVDEGRSAEIVVTSVGRSRCRLRKLSGQTCRTCKEGPLSIVMVERDPQFEGAHLLLVIIQDHEVSIDTVVLGNQVEQRHSDVPKGDIVASLHSRGIVLQVLAAVAQIVGSIRK